MATRDWIVFIAGGILGLMGTAAALALNDWLTAFVMTGVGAMSMVAVYLTREGNR